jgi:hypothetical protein
MKALTPAPNGRLVFGIFALIAEFDREPMTILHVSISRNAVETHGAQERPSAKAPVIQDIEAAVRDD